MLVVVDAFEVVTAVLVEVVVVEDTLLVLVVVFAVLVGVLPVYKYR